MNIEPASKTLLGIEVPEVADQYRVRGLDTWSDAQLIAAVAGIVAEPRQGPSDSFVLHAPLELGARAALLPLVAPDRRHLARLHIVALAAQYETYEPATFPSSTPPLPGQADPAAWLADAFQAGDLDEVDRAAVELSNGASPYELATALADLIIPLTGAAAHGPIFLHQLTRLAPVTGYRTQLLRPLARQLARSPERRIHWIDDWTPAAPGGSSHPDLTRALASTPLLGTPGSSFIDPLIGQVDTSTEVTALLSSSVRPATVTQARSILRTAARSMLFDTTDHAPYGWTHCLTMPQAVLGLSSLSNDPDRAHAVAATHVAAFRAGLGEHHLPPPGEAESAGISAGVSTDVPADPRLDPTALASAAATSHDAHVVKYVLACLDASKWDTGEASLYLRAARRLLDVWDERGGDPTDPLADEA